MNNKDVINLIEEWIHKPAGSRPILEKAIAEQYRKARESQWGVHDGTDSFSDWLSDISNRSASYSMDELENRVAALLDKESDSEEIADTELPLAAKRDSGQHAIPSKLPSDEEISTRTRAILDQLEKVDFKRTIR